MATGGEELAEVRARLAATPAHIHRAAAALVRETKPRLSANQQRIAEQLARDLDARAERASREAQEALPTAPL